MSNPDITRLIGAQDAIRAQNLKHAQTHISIYLVESGCTGAIDVMDGTLSHDGDACPVHEATREHLLQEVRRIEPRGMGAPDADGLASDIEDLRDVLIALIEHLPNITNQPTTR